MQKMEKECKDAKNMKNIAKYAPENKLKNVRIKE